MKDVTRSCVQPDSISLDHVVLWVPDAREALRFYVEVLGLSPVREAEFERREVPFPSVRVNAGVILDLVEDSAWPVLEGATGASGGGRLNHLCLTLSEPRYTALERRLARRGTPLRIQAPGSFGARGPASASGYLLDPAGNVIEVRHYEALAGEAPATRGAPRWPSTSDVKVAAGPQGQGAR